MKMRKRLIFLIILAFFLAPTLMPFNLARETNVSYSIPSLEGSHQTLATFGLDNTYGWGVWRFGSGGIAKLMSNEWRSPTDAEIKQFFEEYVEPLHIRALSLDVALSLDAMGNYSTVHSVLKYAERYGVGVLIDTCEWGEGTDCASFAVGLKSGNRYMVGRDVDSKGTYKNYPSLWDPNFVLWYEKYWANRTWQYYGRYKSLLGIYQYTEFTPFEGYGNDALEEWVNQNPTLPRHMQILPHEDGTPCKLREMFVNKSAMYDTSQLSSDVHTYHKNAFRHWKRKIAADRYGEIYDRMKRFWKDDALFVVQGQTDWAKDNELLASKGLLTETYYIGIGPEEVQKGEYKKTFRRVVYNALPFSGPLYANRSGCSGEGATKEMVARQLMDGITPFNPRIVKLVIDTWNLNPKNTPWGGKYDQLKAYGEILSRMPYIGHTISREEPISSVLIVGDWKNVRREWVEWSLSSGINTTFTTWDKVNTDADLQGYDVVWWHEKRIREDQVSLLDSYVYNGGGLLVCGTASKYNAAGDEQTDLLLGDVLGVHWSTTLRTATSFTFVPHAIWKPWDRNSIRLFDSWVGGSRNVVVKNADVTALVEDDAGHPVMTTRNYGAGRAAYVWNTDVDDRIFSDWIREHKKWGFVYSNLFMWLADEEDRVCPWWIDFASYPKDSGVFLSINGGKGQAMVWLSNNDTVSRTIAMHLEASAFNIDAGGWATVDVLDWTIEKGVGEDVSLVITIPPKSWKPVYVVNQTGNLRELYTNMIIESRAIDVNKTTSRAVYALQGGYDQTCWLILDSTTTPTAITTNTTGTLTQHSSLSTLNASSTLSGWYYDPKGILYVKFKLRGIVEVEITQGFVTATPATPATPDNPLIPVWIWYLLIFFLIFIGGWSIYRSHRRVGTISLVTS